MSTKLVITPGNELKEIKDPSKGGANPVLKFFAHFFSYLFHPVFVPLYIIAFLLFTEPFLFVGASVPEKVFTLARAFINYTFFPLISVALLKGLHFINSIRLKERKDRIIPLIICNIWYFWMWYVWRNLPQMPQEIKVYAFSIFLASSIGLLCNIYLKISLHGIAIGNALALLCLLSFGDAPNISIYLAIAMLIAGLVGSSRLILGDHTPGEFYWGVSIGIVAVILANMIH